MVVTVEASIAKKAIQAQERTEVVDRSSFQISNFKVSAQEGA